jgi:hypothetical protein
VLAYVRDHGLPVPRHDLVVELDDGVVFVQERLPSAPPRRLTPARIDALVEINDRFAGALASRPDVPMPLLCLYCSGDPCRRHEVLATHSARSRMVLEEILRIGWREPASLTGDDLVHVDLTAAIDSSPSSKPASIEWFVRSPDADPVENAAAARLDEILRDRLAPATLRTYWAHWMLHHLCWTIQFASSEAIDWQLDLAESRLA